MTMTAKERVEERLKQLVKLQEKHLDIRPKPIKIVAQPNKEVIHGNVNRKEN